MLDLRIKGGKVIDGTGAVARIADVGVRDGRIVAIGDFAGEATENIDATGLIVAPGFIDTDMTRAIIGKTGQSWEELTKDTLAKNSIKRLGVPSDIAGTVSFLASKDATYMTGQVLYVMGR